MSFHLSFTSALRKKNRKGAPSHQRRLSRAERTQRIAGIAALPTVRRYKMSAVHHAQRKIVCWWGAPEARKDGLVPPLGGLSVAPGNIEVKATKPIAAGRVRYRRSPRRSVSSSRHVALRLASGAVSSGCTIVRSLASRPNPAVEGSCANSRAAPSLLRWASYP